MLHIIMLYVTLMFCIFDTSAKADVGLTTPLVDVSQEFKDAAAVLKKMPDAADLSIVNTVVDVVNQSNALINSIQALPTEQRAANLERVRSDRQQLVRRTAELRSTIEGIRQLRSALQATNSGQTAQEIKLRRESAENNLKVEQFREQKAEEELKNAIDKDKPGIQNFIDGENSKILNLKADLEHLPTVNSNDSELYQQRLNATDIVIRQGQSIAASSDYVLNNIDDLAGELLSTTIFLNSYTNWSTIVFSALVALVIGSFFWITYKANIGSQILAGDSGIQFVTLFALIIAIILFGVLKILEGKELAALLGGLSGYILGRGSTNPFRANGGTHQNGAEAQAPVSGGGTQNTADTRIPAPAGGAAAEPTPVRVRLASVDAMPSAPMSEADGR